MTLIASVQLLQWLQALVGSPFQPQPLFDPGGIRFPNDAIGEPLEFVLD